MRLGFEPGGWDLGLEARIWALRGGTLEEEEEEKIPLCESIGHRPLRGRCPKRGKERGKEREREGKRSQIH